jgi:DNA polymerase III epsilon subunit-like protein
MKDAAELAGLLNHTPYLGSTCVAKLPHSYVAMDTETTGLDPHKDGIVEIAGVKVIDDEVVDTFQSFADCGVRISRDAQAMNHITQQMLRGAPSEHDAVGAFLEFSDGLTLMAHNANFDRGFVESVCAASTDLSCPNPWYDTVSEAKLFSCGRRLSDLCVAFGIDNVDAHRALGDAEALSLAHQAMMSALLEVSTDARDFARFESKEGPLSGETMAFTGEGVTIGQHDAMALAAENGAKLSNGVTKKVTTLVNLSGESTGKARKAAEYADVTGVRTISESEFLGLVGAEPIPEAQPEPETPNAAEPAPEPRAAEQPMPMHADAAEPSRNGGGKARAVAFRIVAVVLALLALVFVFAIPGSMAENVGGGVFAVIFAAAAAFGAYKAWAASSR